MTSRSEPLADIQRQEILALTENGTIANYLPEATKEVTEKAELKESVIEANYLADLIIEWFSSRANNETKEAEKIAEANEAMKAEIVVAKELPESQDLNLSSLRNDYILEKDALASLSHCLTLSTYEYHDYVDNVHVASMHFSTPKVAKISKRKVELPHSLENQPAHLVTTRTRDCSDGLTRIPTRAR
ncbi:hypothetical protein LguiA_008964 [Lonicera macranthoides]